MADSEASTPASAPSRPERGLFVGLEGEGEGSGQRDPQGGQARAGPAPSCARALRAQLLGAQARRLRDLSNELRGFKERT